MAYGLRVRSYKKWAPIIIIVGIIGIGAASISDFDMHALTDQKPARAPTGTPLALVITPSPYENPAVSDSTPSSVPSSTLPAALSNQPQPPSAAQTPATPSATAAPVTITYSEPRCLGAFSATLKNARQFAGATVSWYWEYADQTAHSEPYTLTLGNSPGDYTLNVATGQLGALVKQITGLLSEPRSKQVRIKIVSPFELTGPWITVSSALKAC